MFDLTFRFTAPLWLTAGGGTWYFITLPKDYADQIKFTRHGKRRGFGSVRVRVKIGTSDWATSLFSDSKSGSYLLPIKAAVRKSERLADGNEVSVELSVVE